MTCLEGSMGNRRVYRRNGKLIRSKGNYAVLLRVGETRGRLNLWEGKKGIDRRKELIIKLKYNKIKICTVFLFLENDH